MQYIYDTNIKKELNILFYNFFNSIFNIINVFLILQLKSGIII